MAQGFGLGQQCFSLGGGVDQAGVVLNRRGCGTAGEAIWLVGKQFGVEARGGGEEEKRKGRKGRSNFS